MCGIFGIVNHPEAAHLTFMGLYALQHRGQESAGITTTDGERHYTEKGMGYVADVLTEERLNRLPGTAAIGQVRYSTTGGSFLANSQPIGTNSWRGPMSIGHNGNLVDASWQRKKLETQGAVFQSTTDTEVILHLLARSSKPSVEEALLEVLPTLRGAYSLVLLFNGEFYAIRDSYGFRPLCLGKLGDSFVVASETCAFDVIGASYVRDIAPGEILQIKNGELKSLRLPPVPKLTYCIFEHVYFSRPDSLVFERSVNQSRYKMGRQLARESPVLADIVAPVPDSGNDAALGYSDASGIPLRFGFTRNHYIGRTFIQPRQAIRDFGIKIKLNPVREVLSGKRIVLIDDSIVRGSTSRKIVRLARSVGAVEVHVRISSPPTISPCYYGIDTPTHEELIGANKSVEEIREFIEADSLAYLSLEGMKRSVAEGEIFCSACFDRKYPIAPELIHLEV